MASYYGANVNDFAWTTNATNATTIVYPSHALGIYGTPPVTAVVAPTDWQKAAVKAEPEDEFSWLRKRVQEIEDLAFA